MNSDRHKSRRRRSRWSVVIAVVATAAMGGFASVYQTARVEGTAMAPTLESQDRVFVNKWVYLFSPPQRDDVVMFQYPPDPSKSMVKRVIAQGGDTLRIEDGRVYVNGTVRPDGFVPAKYRSHDDHQEIVVEPDSYYVLGDHRNDSADSRTFGPVPKANIVGRVSMRWWPTPGTVR